MTRAWWIALWVLAGIAGPAAGQETVPPLGTAPAGPVLRLTLSEAIALALENNLDLDLQRLVRKIAEADVQRAEGGGQARGVPLSVREGPRSASATTGGTIGTPLGLGSETNLSIAGGQTLSPGPSIPSFDPVLTGALRRTRLEAPQANAFASGTSVLESDITAGGLAFLQGFSTGGQLAVTFDVSSQEQNNRRIDVNPYTQAWAGVTFTQPLLRGFGPAVNTRYIRITRRNRDITDLVFQQQVISTVAAVIRLYWDLASLKTEAAVRRLNLERAERLLADTEAQVEVGTRAPIDAVRVRAEVARARRDVIAAVGLARQQETILNDFLSRDSVADPTTLGRSIDPVDLPTVSADAHPPALADLVRQALDSRPDLEQARLQIDNTETALEGSRHLLRPGVDLVLGARRSALAGDVNPLVMAGAAPHVPDPAFVGTFRDALAQIGRAAYPDWSIAVQVSVPLRQRTASADVARDTIALAQQRLRLSVLEKQVAVEIQNAMTAMEQAKATLESATREREFQEQALAAEEERLQVGVSTTYLLIQYQRDLTQAQSAEAAASANYAIARAALDRATGRLLDIHGLIVEGGDVQGR